MTENGDSTIYVDRADRVPDGGRRHAYSKQGKVLTRECGLSRTPHNAMNPRDTVSLSEQEYANLGSACRRCMKAIGIESGNEPTDLDVDIEELMGTDSGHNTPVKVGVTPDTNPAPTPTVDQADITPPTEEPDKDDREVIGTVDLSPDWDWLGLQLAKLGLDTMARRAFNENLTPAEVYGDIVHILNDNKTNRDMDFEPAVPGGLTLVEAEPDPEELKAAKQQLGVAQ